jgi:hypothetical protein
MLKCVENSTGNGFVVPIDRNRFLHAKRQGKPKGQRCRKIGTRGVIEIACRFGGKGGWTGENPFN